jgi:hypothetical protein
MFKEESSFPKKRSKRLLFPVRACRRKPTLQETKVFWFFFSKKNILASLVMTAAVDPIARARGPAVMLCNLRYFAASATLAAVCAGGVDCAVVTWLGATVTTNEAPLAEVAATGLTLTTKPGCACDVSEATEAAEPLSAAVRAALPCQ